MDQAKRLRDLVEQRSRLAEETAKTVNARVMTVTSGKGGVGKSNFTVNLAVQLSKKQKRVVIIDADFGLANIEVLLGVSPSFTFKDIMTGTAEIEEALSDGPMGIKFLSGGSGLAALTDVNDRQITELLNNFVKLDAVADFILIDTGAGISKHVVDFIRASKEAVIITTSDPTSMTDAYAVIKSAVETEGEKPDFKVVVNRVYNPSEGREAFDKLRRVCEQFMGINIESLGNIPYDPYMIKAVKRQEPVSICFPNSDSSRCIEAISSKLLADVPAAEPSGIRGFMGKLMGIMGRKN
ncbi:MAG: MinD/ParA family protein [Defluviitaleaceae bacterium]|nr:MinD/ParA family protein [Defluviitaleaceae bacterium]